MGGQREGEREEERERAREKERENTFSSQPLVSVLLRPAALVPFLWSLWDSSVFCNIIMVLILPRMILYFLE